MIRDGRVRNGKTPFREFGMDADWRTLSEYFKRIENRTRQPVVGQMLRDVHATDGQVTMFAAWCAFECYRSSVRRASKGGLICNKCFMSDRLMDDNPRDANQT